MKPVIFLIWIIFNHGLHAHAGAHRHDGEIFGKTVKIDHDLYSRLMDHNPWKRNIEGYIRENASELRGDLLDLFEAANSAVHVNDELVNVSFEEGVLYKLSASNAAVVFPHDQEIASQILAVCKKDKDGKLFPGCKIELATRLSRSGSLNEGDLLCLLIDADVFNKVEELALFHGLKERLSKAPEDREAVGVMLAILHGAKIDSGVDEEVVKYANSINYDIDRYLKERMRKKNSLKKDGATENKYDDDSEVSDNTKYIYVISMGIIGCFVLYGYKKWRTNKV